MEKMKIGFLIRGKGDTAHALYTKKGQLCFGVDYTSDSVVTVYVEHGVGFITSSKKVIDIVRIIPAVGGIAICSMLNRKFLSANPSKFERTDGVAFNRVKIDSWETFKISPVETNPNWLDNYFDIVKNQNTTLGFDLIEAGHEIDIPVLTYLLTCHPKKIIDIELSKRIAKPRFLECLLTIAGGNYLITPLLKDLTQPRRDKTPLKIGMDRDIYGRVPDIKNPWLIINTAIRKHIKKTKKCCIVATARNEGIYIVEWVAYHLLLGFDKIFLYTNNNQDESLELLREMHDLGLIQLIESDVGPGGNAQVKAYSHALLALPEVSSHEWCAFIDVDEFITYDQDKFLSLSNYLDWVGGTDADVIALSWILAGNPVASNDWIDRPVTLRNRKVSAFQSNLIKCIVKPESAVTSGPHYPISTSGCELVAVNSERDRYVSERSAAPTDITKCKSPSFENAYLYHYELKSFPELIWKYSRNRGNYSAITEDICLNDQFLSRVGHFRKCIERPDSTDIKLAIKPEALVCEINAIMNRGRLTTLLERVREATRQRYDKLLAHLPHHIENNVNKDNPYDISAATWIKTEFISPAK